MQKKTRWWLDNRDKFSEERRKKKQQIYDSFSQDEKDIFDALDGVTLTVYGDDGKKTAHIDYDFDSRDYYCHVDDCLFVKSSYEKAINRWVDERLKDCGVPFRARALFYVTIL